MQEGPHECQDARVNGSPWDHLEADYHIWHLAAFKDLACAYFPASYHIFSISLVTVNYFLILWPSVSNAYVFQNYLPLSAVPCP